MLYAVKKRRAMLRYVKTCGIGEISWLLPFQQGVGCGAPSSSRTGGVLPSPFPSNSQRAHQCLTLTQREQVYCTNALHLFSAAAVQGMTQVLLMWLLLSWPGSFWGNLHPLAQRTITPCDSLCVSKMAWKSSALLWPQGRIQVEFTWRAQGTTRLSLVRSCLAVLTEDSS